MSECNDEVFTQEAGLVCAKTLDVIRLTKENKKLKVALEVARDAIEFYASRLNWTIDHQDYIEESFEVNKGEFAATIRNDCDKPSISRAGGYGGKKARQAIKNIDKILGDE